MSTASVENRLITRESRTSLTPVVPKTSNQRVNGNGSSSSTTVPNHFASRVQAAKLRLSQTNGNTGLKNGIETIEIKSVNVGETLKALGSDGEPSSRYFITKELGEGGMGQVFLANELGEEPGEVKRVVAVKTLHPGNHKTNDVKRLLREAEAQRRITHQNVVSVLDFGEDNDRPFIVMEYVEGTTLKNVLEEIHSGSETGKFPLQLMLSIIISVLEGLQVAHQNGVVHRDIKPDNVFMDGSGIPKLADFGLAKPSNATTITDRGVITGTLQYTAPERCNALPGDLRSDIYSTGVMLYEMLTGMKPFHVEGGGALEIIGKHMNHTPPPPSGINSVIPKLLDRIVMKSLAKDPKNRFSSASELADHLRQVIDPRNLSSPTTKLTNNSSPVTSLSAV